MKKSKPGDTQTDRNKESKGRGSSTGGVHSTEEVATGNLVACESERMETG